MSPIKTSVRNLGRWRRSLRLAVVLTGLVFLAGLFSTPLAAQGRRGGASGFAPRGGSGFRPSVAGDWHRGFGFRYGWGGWWGYWYYPTVYSDATVDDYVIWPPNTASQTAQIIYDATGKPVGVIIVRPNGSREFVPVTP